MDMEEEHRKLLLSLGLREEDFTLFDGENVSYEYDLRKGVRLYDPDYTTSYDEYIDVDGWSSWSSEQDTFMQTILKPAQEEARRREALSREATEEEISDTLRAKFGGTEEREEGE